MKPKWKPKEEERYYYPNIMNDTLEDYYEWSDHSFDFNMYDRNLICKTKTEAIALAKAMLKVAERRMK